MISTRFKTGIIFFTIVMVMWIPNANFIQNSQGGISMSSLFDDWTPIELDLNPSCNCHTLTNTVGTGSVVIVGSNNISTNANFNLNVSVTGFTEGQDQNIVIGFVQSEMNNSLFKAPDKTHFITGISVDSSGDSSPRTFTLKAPDSEGNYTVQFFAVFSASSNPFTYLSQTFDIEVLPVLDEIPPTINQLYINSTPYFEGIEIRAETTFEVNVTDENLADVEYACSQTGIFQSMVYDNSTGFYKIILYSTEFCEEGHMIVKATDLAGNSVNETYLFTVNNSGLLPNADLISFCINPQSVQLNTQNLDEKWTFYEKLMVPEFGTDGYIQSLHNDLYVYFLLAYDSSYTWVSIEFNVTDDSTTFMNENNDAWIFGEGDFEYSGDGHMVGATYPEIDERNDVFFNKIVDEENGLTYITTMRLLDTGDTSGHDVVIDHKTTMNLVFASNVHHTDDHQKYSFVLTDIKPGNLPTSQTTDDTGGGFVFSPKEVSDFVFIFSVAIVIVTVVIHGSLRVISRPIKHEKRIVRTDRLPDQPSSISQIKNFLFKGKK